MLTFFWPLLYLSSSVGRALGLESRVSWVQVPPEAADFSLKKSLPQVSLNCVVFLCVYLEGVLKFVYHVCTQSPTLLYNIPFVFLRVIHPSCLVGKSVHVELGGSWDRNINAVTKVLHGFES